MGLVGTIAIDAQVSAIVQRLIPPPPGADPIDFYNCLARGCRTYRDYVPAGWDAGAVVDAIEVEVIDPRENANALFTRHTHLTRLFTTMSADEMLLDPVFRLDDGMPEVSNVRTATLLRECSSDYLLHRAPERIELPSGRTMRVSEGTRETRDDATYCRDMGGSLEIPPPPVCDDGSAGRDGGAGFDGGMDAAAPGDGSATADGGSCSASGTSDGAAWWWIVGALALCARRRRFRSFR